ncbi:hypothetical protein [Citrobacter sp. Cpo150]|uniref:hypothetical protein n=1 Tax=Citrobacter sp. Cpo150 TaxID=2985154 RepID=UPI0025750A45|nr:hypothetical protein [Citrobacter sp. Cpo150]MDM2765746.1 hypothetical protein [Citrobacter sp. Cpo150]
MTNIVTSPQQFLNLFTVLADETPTDSLFFSYGTEHNFELHKTAAEAQSAAEAAIDDYRGDACDGWSEEVESVCWGVISQSATKVDERPRNKEDRCDPAIDTICDYALQPAMPEVSHHQEEIDALRSFKEQVCKAMGVGAHAPTFAVTTGIDNLRRFANILHAIEREFFTQTLPAESDEEDVSTTCPLHWGMEVDAYLDAFRKHLPDIQPVCQKKANQETMTGNDHATLEAVLNSGDVTVIDIQPQPDRL